MSIFVLFNRSFKILIMLYMVSCLMRVNKQEFGLPLRTHTPHYKYQILSLVVHAGDSGYSGAVNPS